MSVSPAISVLVPAWNAATFIHTAIASLKQQTLTDFEALVVDDASTDNTAAAITAAVAGDPRFKLIQLDQNGGSSAARNAGLAVARGAWIAVLDADDAIEPERLARLKHAAERSALDIVCDNPMICEDIAEPEAGKPMLRMALDAPPRPVDLARFVRANCPSKGQGALGYLKPMFRASFLRDHAIRYPKAQPIAEDYTFFADALAHGARAAIVPNRDYFYWVREGSISRKPTSNDFALMLQADDDFRSRHASRLSKPEIAALNARRRELVDMHTYQRFVEGIRTGNGRQTAEILRRPLAIRFLKNTFDHHTAKILAIILALILAIYGLARRARR
jgi:succinoglycan biosynthesis protein ExoO